jgi:hypothetical protein
MIISNVSIVKSYGTVTISPPPLTILRTGLRWQRGGSNYRYYTELVLGSSYTILISIGIATGLL